MSENVLFVRSEDDENDPWDDSLLIKAYDAALAKAKKEILKDQPSSSGVSRPVPAKWRKGQSCQAKFSEDDKFYEGNILKIVGDAALVRYIGYGNVETVKLEDLRPSQGNSARRAQKKDAKIARTETEEDSMDVDTDSSATAEKSEFKKPNPRMAPLNRPQKPSCHPISEGELPYPPPPPPPPGLFNERGAPGEDETLYAMLMSWYMSGYHTGYYEGRKVSRKK